MRRFIEFTLVAFLAFTTSSAVAAKLPSPVMAKISELKSLCSGIGGELIDPEQAILEADLNQDGRPDYVIDQSALNCDGAASAFSGSGGSEIDVFVSTPGGYINGWSGGAFGAKVEQNTVWLALGGRYCGQKKPSSNAAARPCERALSWSPAKGKMHIDPKIKPRPASFQ